MSDKKTLSVEFVEHVFLFIIKIQDLSLEAQA